MVETDDAGYFETRRAQRGSYRYRAFDSGATDARPIGVSRTAAPIP